MSGVHVDELLVDHLRGELEDPERTRVDTHLAECAECRAAREGFARIVTALAATAPPAPPIHWGAYRAELRERLERGAARRGAGAPWDWLARPLPALVAAALVAVLVVSGLPGLHAPGAPDPLALDNTILASRLDMIARLDVVQQLDLLEDFNVINELDELPGPSKS
jgi:anti-sigma factor RsiW